MCCPCLIYLSCVISHVSMCIAAFYLFCVCVKKWHLMFSHDQDQGFLRQLNKKGNKYKAFASVQLEGKICSIFFTTYCTSVPCIKQIDDALLVCAVGWQATAFSVPCLYLEKKFKKSRHRNAQVYSTCFRRHCIDFREYSCRAKRWFLSTNGVGLDSPC